MAAAAADLASIIRYRNTVQQKTGGSKVEQHDISNDKKAYAEEQMVLEKLNNSSSMASAAADLASIIRYRNTAQQKISASKAEQRGIPNDKASPKSKEPPTTAMDIRDISTPTNMDRWVNYCCLDLQNSSLRLIIGNLIRSSKCALMSIINTIQGKI